MARIAVEEVYRGEKYGVMSAAMADYITNGRPAEHDERTWLEMLIVKHALIAPDKMKLEGGSLSGMIDNEPPSCYVCRVRMLQGGNMVAVQYEGCMV